MSRVRLVIFSSPALLSLFADLMSKTTKHSVFPAKSSGVVSGFPLALGPCFQSDAHPCGSCFLSGPEKAPQVSSRCLPSSAICWHLLTRLPVSLPTHPPHRSQGILGENMNLLLTTFVLFATISLCRNLSDTVRLVTALKALCNLLSSLNPAHTWAHMHAYICAHIQAHVCTGMWIPMHACVHTHTHTALWQQRSSGECLCLHTDCLRCISFYSPLWALVSLSAEYRDLPGRCIVS